MSISNGVFPERVVGLSKYHELPPPSASPPPSAAPSSSASSKRPVIVSLAHLLQVNVPNTPDDWEITAHASQVEFLAGLDFTPRQYATAPKQLNPILNVLKDYRQKLTDKLTHLRRSIVQSWGGDSEPVAAQTVECNQKERKEHVDTSPWEQLVPDPPDYDGRCALRVTVNVLGGALQTKHLLGNHKDSGRVRVSLTVGVGVCEEYVRHMRVLTGVDNSRTQQVRIHWLWGVVLCCVRSAQSHVSVCRRMVCKLRCCQAHATVPWSV